MDSTQAARILTARASPTPQRRNGAGPRHTFGGCGGSTAFHRQPDALHQPARQTGDFQLGLSIRNERRRARNARVEAQAQRNLTQASRIDATGRFPFGPSANPGGKHNPPRIRAKSKPPRGMVAAAVELHRARPGVA